RVSWALVSVPASAAPPSAVPEGELHAHTSAISAASPTFPSLATTNEENAPVRAREVIRKGAWAESDVGNGAARRAAARSARRPARAPAGAHSPHPRPPPAPPPAPSPRPRCSPPRGSCSPAATACFGERSHGSSLAAWHSNAH